MTPDDEAEQAALARRQARWTGYRREVTPLPDGMWYWHLFRDDVRVNGGLSRSREDALADAGFAVGRHLWDLFDRPETAR